MLSQLVVGGIKCVLGESTRKRFLEACAWCPLDFAHEPLLFADFAFCPFSVINHSHEYNYMPHPASPLSKSSSCS